MNPGACVIDTGAGHRYSHKQEDPDRLRQQDSSTPEVNDGRGVAPARGTDDEIESPRMPRGLVNLNGYPHHGVLSTAAG